jgi:pilus assembly protein CpaB
MNPRIVMALSISAGMALLVSAVFYQIAIRGRGAPVEQVEMREIVVPAKDLEIGAMIAATDLKLNSWPSSKIPADAVTEMEELVDRVPISRLLAEEPISARRLAVAGSGAGLASIVPMGMRAMSVRVNDVIGVSGFLLPEARVDVLVTGTPRNAESGQMTKTILSNVRVISAGENLEPDASGRPQRVAVVTLLVTPEQAETLTLASMQGRLQLILRNSRDEEIAQTRGVQEPQLFTGRVEEPKPVVRRRPAPLPVVQFVPPPPPPSEVEVIQGNEKSVAKFGSERETHTRD